MGSDGVVDTPASGCRRLHRYILSVPFALRGATSAAFVIAFLMLPEGALAGPYVVPVLGALHEIGIPARREGAAIISGGDTFVITNDCTYVDWLLVALPWVWNRVTPTRSVVWMIAIAACVVTLNAIRIVAAIVLRNHGYSWFYAHDLIDGLTWYPSLVLFVMVCVYRSAIRCEAARKTSVAR